MTKNLLIKILAILFPLLFLAACGGGGGGEATSKATTQGFSSGAISGFGSVIVNGIHWSDDASVEITLDDDKGAKDDLKVGMVVEIEGDDSGNGSGKARKIRFENIVRGPVESVDLTGGTLVVLGQTVKTSGATVFDNLVDLSGIAKGDIVAVSGWLDNLDPAQPNNIVARRIEKKPAPFSGVLKVKGFVKSLDGTARTFKINNLVVDFGTAVFPNGSAAALKNGLFVDVRTNALPTPLGGTLVAESVKVKEVKPAVPEGAQVEVEGIITDLDLVAKTFKVGGIPVDAKAIDISGLANGMKVEVKGVFSNGVLVLGAGKVEREMKAHIKIQALVQAADATGNTLTLLGKKVKVTPFTQFRDKALDMRNFSLNDVLVGDALEVRAFEDSNGDIVAVKIERQIKPLQNVILQGRMDSKDPAATSLTIIGVKVQGGSGTEWQLANQQQVNAATWFANINVNSVVKAKGIEGADGKSVDVTSGQVEVDED